MTSKSITLKKHLPARTVLWRCLLFVIAIGFAIAFLLPTILTISNSFMESTEISSNYGIIFEKNEQGGKKYIAKRVNLKFIPDKVSLSQYSTALIKSPQYLLKFWNSVFLVAPIVVFQIIVATGAAYSFARFRSKFKSIIFFVYTILMLMPYQVILVPNFLVSQYLGILNTRWAIILPGIFSPFSVFILTKFMRRIPVGIIEAAKLDGCGEWQIFTKIALPVCKSTIYSITILVFIDYWNMVEQPLALMNDAEMHPLSVFLSQVNSQDIGLAFAVAAFYMIPTLLMFLHGEQYLVEGIAYSGGVKG